MDDISKLEPTIVWKIFHEITKVPRPSKKEEKIIAYLVSFAEKNMLEYHKDAIGNVLIKRPAGAAAKDKPVVVLQSHMDMVCEKNSDKQFDFDNDPIQLTVTPDGWVKADGTTLGADDGIGMAAALAVLLEEDETLPPIEALFTVDEETGLTGAFNLGDDMLKGDYLINLDSEDEGEIFIGCAGGIDTIAYFPATREAAPQGLPWFRIDISGLRGGHSGDDIDKGLGNSNKILARFLLKATVEADLRLAAIDGGNLRNAIPREAHAEFCVPQYSTARLFEIYDSLLVELREEFGKTEPNIDLAIAEIPSRKEVLCAKQQKSLLMALQGVPNGVLAMSQAMPGLVETSTNLASVKETQGQIVITTSQRSAIDGARFNAAASVRSVFELAGATVKHSEGYPGWNPNPDSHLLKVAEKCYRELFATEPKVRAIHAGLECGLFLQKHPDLQMISIGPTLRGVHSPDEKLEIATVDKFWKHLLAVLKNI